MYIHPTKNFKMPKTQKRIMASITSDETRNLYKNIMVQAILTGEIVPENKKEREAKHG
jgi:hypothetical protein